MEMHGELEATRLIARASAPERCVTSSELCLYCFRIGAGGTRLFDKSLDVRINGGSRVGSLEVDPYGRMCRQGQREHRQLRAHLERAAPDREIAASRRGSFADPITRRPAVVEAAMFDRQLLRDALGEGESNRTSVYVYEQKVDGFEQISEITCQVKSRGQTCDPCSAAKSVRQPRPVALALDPQCGIRVERGDCELDIRRHSSSDGDPAEAMRLDSASGWSGQSCTLTSGRPMAPRLPEPVPRR